MPIKIATASEIQNNFEKYLNLLISGHVIIVTDNGYEVGRLVPKNATASYLTDSLTGILAEVYDINALRKPLKMKYHSISRGFSYFKGILDA